MNTPESSSSKKIFDLDSKSLNEPEDQNNCPSTSNSHLKNLEEDDNDDKLSSKSGSSNYSMGGYTDVDPLGSKTPSSDEEFNEGLWRYHYD